MQHCIAEEPVEDMGNPNPFEDEDLPIGQPHASYI